MRTNQERYEGMIGMKSNRTYLHSGYEIAGYAFTAYQLHTVDVKR